MVTSFQTAGLGAQQVRTLPYQASTVPMQVSTAQTGFDITGIMNMILPLMIMVMMVKMMSSAMGSATA